MILFGNWSLAVGWLPLTALWSLQFLSHAVALLHLYATSYSTGLLPDEMALDYLIILL